jgi:hypothetical protein
LFFSSSPTSLGSSFSYSGRSVARQQLLATSLRLNNKAPLGARHSCAPDLLLAKSGFGGLNNKANYEGAALSSPRRFPSCVCFSSSSNENAKQGRPCCPWALRLGGTSEAGEQHFVDEPPPCAEGEKGLPLWAKLDAKSGCHVKGSLKTSGPGSPLMSMVTTSSLPPPGGSPISGLGSSLLK